MIAAPWTRSTMKTNKSAYIRKYSLPPIAIFGCFSFSIVDDTGRVANLRVMYDYQAGSPYQQPTSARTSAYLANIDDNPNVSGKILTGRQGALGDTFFFAPFAAFTRASAAFTNE